MCYFLERVCSAVIVDDVTVHNSYRTKGEIVHRCLSLLNCVDVPFSLFTNYLLLVLLSVHKCSASV